jgi:O-methyltransferase involved in polyketide biosynthesis
VQIPIDLRKTSVCEALVDRLPHDRPVLIMWEGMSMYFQETEVKDILSDMRKLMAHPDSVLWVDIVDRGPIVDTEAFPTEVQNFMHGMQVLGEPFTFGCDRPEDFIEGLGLRCLEVVTSDVYFADAADPVFSIYQFCTISGDKTSGRLPVTFRPAAIAKVATPINRPHFALPINHTSPAGKSATSQTT